LSSKRLIVLAQFHLSPYRQVVMTHRHLNCAGTGSWTIVAEAGSGEDSITWTLLQNSLSKTYRFCSYNRAGTGWSEPQPGVRDALAISSQLHELLKTAHEQGPFVLLGHSLGGPYIREYAEQYPSNISALIFLDAATPSAYEGKAADALEAVMNFAPI
jgi:pimeloyl-ACP methyl ester carboxylesterase